MSQFLGTLVFPWVKELDFEQGISDFGERKIKEQFEK